MCKIAFLFLVIVLLPIASISQNMGSGIDKHALGAPNNVTKDVDKLGIYLTSTATSDKDKLRAFYIWITANIDYDMNMFLSGDRSKSITSNDVLRCRKSVCQGYAELLLALCKTASIPCYIVTGYSKGYGYDSGKKLTQTDHAWNVVKLDSIFYLVDATWGAGVINHRGKYEQKFNESYFLSKPENFIYTHLPADPMWQLLPNPISMDDFSLDSVSIKMALKREGSFSFVDTIKVFETLPDEMREMNTAERAYRFNPQNHDGLGFAYLGYAFFLSKDMPDPNKDAEAFVRKQKQMLLFNEKALEFFKKSNSQQGRNGLDVCKTNIKIIKQNLSQFK